MGNSTCSPPAHKNDLAFLLRSLRRSVYPEKEMRRLSNSGEFIIQEVLGDGTGTRIASDTLFTLPQETTLYVRYNGESFMRLSFINTLRDRCDALLSGSGYKPIKPEIIYLSNEDIFCNNALLETPSQGLRFALCKVEAFLRSPQEPCPSLVDR